MNWCKHQSGCSQINWFFTTIWIVGVFVIQTWRQCLSRICKVSWSELFIKINWFFTSASIYDLNMELVVKKMQPRLVGSIYSPAEQIDWYFITIQILVYCWFLVSQTVNLTRNDDGEKIIFFQAWLDSNFKVSTRDQLIMFRWFRPIV